MQSLLNVYRVHMHVRAHTHAHKFYITIITIYPVYVVLTDIDLTLLGMAPAAIDPHGQYAILSHTVWYACYTD